MNEVVLEIEKFDKKGDGVAYIKRGNKRKRVVVLNGLVKDKVLAELFRNKRKATILNIIEKSPYRVAPICPKSDICGGCRLQSMGYKYQLKQKQKLVVETFKEYISKGYVDLFDIIESDCFRYRNKLEFSFSENRKKTKFLGFKMKNSARFVVDIEECFLAPKWFSTILQKVKSWWKNSSIKAYDFTNGEGSLLSLTLREGKNTSSKMVILKVSGNDKFAILKENIEDFKSIIEKELGKVSIFLQIEQKNKGYSTQNFEIKLLGDDHIFERLKIFEKEFLFAISPNSFFQPNSSQAKILYEKAVEILQLQKDDILFDLYCGTGTLGILCSYKVKKVIGIEINPYAVMDGEKNIELNNIENMEIIKGDVAKVLAKIEEKADAILLDPPRSGLGQEAIFHISKCKAKKILYISCNILTQKEDIDKLCLLGYNLQAIQPIDQFPHTIHIENICFLELS